MFTLSPECVQRSYHLEALKPPEYLTFSRDRHIHLLTLCHLGTGGARKFDRVSSAFPKRLKVKIGNVIFGLRFWAVNLT